MNWKTVAGAFVVAALTALPACAAENFTFGETVPLTATTSGASASFALPQSGNYPDVMISNAGTNTAFISFGTANAVVPVAATLNATPVLPGETMVLHKGTGVTQVNGITASGTAILYFTAGQGN